MSSDNSCDTQRTGFRAAPVVDATSGDPHSSDASFLGIVGAGLGTGPADVDMLGLPALAEVITLHIAIREGKDSLSLPDAGRAVLRALLGVDEHKGGPPMALAVYAMTRRGPQLLDAKVQYLEGERFPSERERRLQAPMLLLLQGYKLDEIEDAGSLAVVRVEALKAFGISKKTLPDLPALQSLAWPVHDWVKWGNLGPAAGRPERVRRVVDVVHLRCNERVSLREAAGLVVDELAQRLPSISSWSLLQPGGQPVALDDGDLWRPAPAYFFDRAPDSYPEWDRVPADNLWAKFVKANEVPGLAGLLECLRSTFRCAKTPDELDCGIAATLAVPESVAQQVAGIGALAVARTGQAVVYSTAVDAESVQTPLQVGVPLVLAITLAQFLAEWERGGAANPAMKAASKMAKKYGMSRSTVQRRLKVARVERTARALAEKPANSVFAMGEKVKAGSS